MSTNISKDQTRTLEPPVIESYYPYGLNLYAPIANINSKKVGGAKKETKKRAESFCKCIKGVRKTLRNVKSSKEKESRAIAICVRSMQKKYGRTLKKFTCRGKTVLVTQPIKY